MKRSAVMRSSLEVVVRLAPHGQIKTAGISDHLEETIIFFLVSIEVVFMCFIMLSL